VVAYPENFDKIINLIVRFNNNFRRFKHAQEKLDKEIRNLLYRKKRDPDTIDWQANNAFKKRKKGQYKKEKEKKLQSNFKYFNCGK
jgi:hypothetical protein